MNMDQISEEYIILFQNVCMAMQGLQVILKTGLRFVNGERGEHFVEHLVSDAQKTLYKEQAEVVPSSS